MLDIITQDSERLLTAMGGIEFGASLLKKATVEVKEDGTADMKLSLGKSQVTIYGVTCDTFIDGKEEGAYIGYQDGGTWKTASYTQGTDTALNSANESVNCVNSVTLPLSSASDTYQLALYVNSNVMGTQFGGDGANYAATLTVDWSSIQGTDGSVDTTEPAENEEPAENGEPDKKTTQSATVEFNVECGYEVEIPAQIMLDTATKEGTYTITAKNFVIGESGYVIVKTKKEGTLTNGTDKLKFTNTLTGTKLQKSDDTLKGTIAITSDIKNPGKYTGTIDFTINYYSGAE